MNEHKSDTLEQRKKAQQEFLKLKRMQAGEVIDNEPQKEVIPLTFSEKIKNFWYHYKAQTIIITFLAIAFAICIQQCASKPNYDAEVILYSNNAYSAEQVDLLTEYMTQFFNDTNGDGKVQIVISDCSYTTDGTFDSTRANTLATKLNATIASGFETQLYIVDSKYMEQLNTLAQDYGGFFIDTVPMPSYVATITDSEGYSFPEGLIIGKRLVIGTTMENNKTAIAAQEEATLVLEKIKNHNK